ncbi:competence protein CoiA family protein [Streptomyces roseolus]|uniref:competence protein CoiA family protein n=1 Tax=Streptomyces roseolus TaxID=67358 RepID=UPI003667C3BA
MTPFPDEEDTRKVQTAVIGGAESDDPVFLPYDHDDYDLFIRGRSRDDFYCGTLLGGCGKKLTAKRYTDKKCHFAHRPPVRCRRTANGESSADHLYIGQALTRWLSRQNHPRAKASYRTVGDRPGGTVDFRLSGGRQHLRVQMARMGLNPWRTEADELARHADCVEWLFGPESMLAFDRVDSHGYAIRVDCRTSGGTREVRVGTQLPGNTIEWTTLSECSMTPLGIVTPSLVRTSRGIVPRGSATEATSPTRVSFQLADETVAFTAAVPGAGPQSQSDPPGRAYDVDAQPLGSAVIRARLLLPPGAATPQPSRVYLLRDRVTLSPLGPAGAETPVWLLTAAGIRRLEAREAAAWSELKPAGSDSVAPAPTGKSRSSGLSDPEIVASFRESLERAARVCARVEWSALVREAGMTGQLTPERQTELLIALDFPRADDKAVLSSLIKTDGVGPVGVFAAVLTGLGWAPGLLAEQVHRIHQQETRRAYALWDETKVRKRAEVKTEGKTEEKAEGNSSSAAAPPKQTARTSSATGRLLSPVGLPELQLVLALREHLRARAKNGAADTTWSELSEATGFDFGALTSERRAHLLFRVDDPLKEHDLMYAALVVTGRGTPLPYFPALLQRHGRPVPGLQSEAHRARRLETDRIRDAYAGNTDQRKVASPAPAGTSRPASASKPALHPAPTSTERPLGGSATAAIGKLIGLRWRFDAARKSGDLAEAKKVRQQAAELYSTKLSPEAREEYRPSLQEMSDWIREREDESALAELRPPLDDLVQNGVVAEADALSEGLAQAGTTDPAPIAEDTARPSREQLAELAAIVRSALQESARNRTTTTWSAIRYRLGAGLPHLHPDDQGEVLVLADVDTPADEPLLSALITTNNGELHPLYRHVAFSLDRQQPQAQEKIHAQWQLDVLRLYNLWKHR